MKPAEIKAFKDILDAFAPEEEDAAAPSEMSTTVSAERLQECKTKMKGDDWTRFINTLVTEKWLKVSSVQIISIRRCMHAKS